MVLLAIALAHDLSHYERFAVDAAALGWTAVAWGFGLAALRARAEQPVGAEQPSQASRGPTAS